MAAEYGIFRLNSRSGGMNRFTPSVDGAPLVFTSLKAARDWAYDNGIAGGRNQHTYFLPVEPSTKA